MIDLLTLGQEFKQNGYTIARALFSAEEAARYRDHFMALRGSASYQGDLVNQWDNGETDPLKRYPRMFNMHRWDEVSRRWLLDERIRQCMVAMLDREPYAIQTMLYFKPPGSRGQALHQDQYYLRARPGTSIAAWMALDPIDEANGCLQMVPNTQDLPLICPEQADEAASFTTIAVPLPPGLQPVPMILAPGDVLFFNGQIIHGSFPNTTQDRFRRSLVGHYIEGHAQQVAAFDHPVLRMDGTVVTEMAASPDGGECGVWVDHDGRHLVEINQLYETAGSLETLPL
ncbi:MAG TPA: phytanoyl-CoA dioxygenase family protein [Caldilineaceae bacterium]|nr:phytanoyl-CoA dioxygenase family protein [Caldilineaceae bacterium]